MTSIVAVCNAVGRMSAALMLVALAADACAQPTYPSKAIRLIVPSPPGANRDLSARLLGQKLAEAWGQNVIVDNRPGGNTLIGSEALVKATPDGHTLLLVDVSHLINGLVVPNYPYNALKVFAAVGTFNNSPYVLTINPSLPVSDLKEFVAHAKSRPGQLNYGTSGTASAAHLTAEIMTGVVGIKMQHISYKGGGQVLNDLASGQVQMYLATAVTWCPLSPPAESSPWRLPPSRAWAPYPEYPRLPKRAFPASTSKTGMVSLRR